MAHRRSRRGGREPRPLKRSVGPFDTALWHSSGHEGLPIRQTMANESTFMLFCPPMPPLRLTDGVVTIGRHPECELNLRMDDVSRRHAQVSFEQGRWHVSDLGSTNGTFVNGQKVEGQRALSPGDHIEVGENAVTFCELGGTAAFPSRDLDARTVVFDRTADVGTDAELRGELREIPCAPLFQLLEMNRSSGRLDVQTKESAANVWFESGHPVHAISEKHAGFETLLALVGLREGRFVFAAGEMAPEKTIQASVTEVLMEACRLEDEQNRS